MVELPESQLQIRRNVTDSAHTCLAALQGAWAAGLDSLTIAKATDGLLSPSQVRELLGLPKRTRRKRK